MEGEPTLSLYTYAMTKRMLYQGMRALGTQYGLKWLCVVPSTLYGPGYETDGKQLHFIYDLIRKIKNASQGGDPPVLWGDGYQRRELIHVEDFTSELLKLDQKITNKLFNIGAGVDHSIKDFASFISAILDYDTKWIQYDETRYTGARSKLLDISKLSDCLAPLERISLEVGLKQIIESHRDIA
jgi:GDP-L-fucose synthase